MRRLFIATLALALGLSAAAQQTGQKVTLVIDGVPFELTWVESGSVTVPEHEGYRTITWDMRNDYYWIDTKKKVERPILSKVTREVKGFWISQRLTGTQRALYDKKITPSADPCREKDFMHGDMSAYDFVTNLSKESGLGAQVPLLEEWLRAREAGALPDVQENVPEGVMGWRYYSASKGNPYYPVYNYLDLDWPTSMITYKERREDGKLKKDDYSMKGKWKDYRLYPASQANDADKGLHYCTTRFIVRNLPAGFGGEPVYGIVQSGDKFGYWYNDKLEIDCEYDEIQSVTANPRGLLLRKGSKWGYYAFSYRKLVPAVYDHLKFVEVNDAKAKPYFSGTGIEFMQDGKRGFMDPSGKVIMPACLRRADLDMNVWLRNVGAASYDYAYEKKAQGFRTQRGEFEKTDDFKARQEDPALQDAYVQEHMEGFEREYLEGVISQTLKNNKGVINFLWWAYHADDEYFAFFSAMTPYGFYRVPVSVSEAPAFKDYVEKADPKALLKTCYICVCNGTQQIARVTFALPDGKVYEYVNPDVTPDITLYPFTELAPESFFTAE